jgi:hypothetical protein
MSLLDWYLHKADQCARLAKEAREAGDRARFESERRTWLEVAAQAAFEESGEPNAPPETLPRPKKFN